MAWARHGHGHGHGMAWHGMASVNQTRPHCVNQMRKTHSKALAARHGRGTAWAWHAMCESAFTRRNTLRRQLYLWGWRTVPCVGGVGQMGKLQLMFFCEYEALATLRDSYLSSLFLDPVDVRMGANWKFMKGTGLPWFGQQSKGHKRPDQGLRASGPYRTRTHYSFDSMSWWV